MICSYENYRVFFLPRNNDQSNVSGISAGIPKQNLKSVLSLCGDLYICAKFCAMNYIYLTMDSKRTIKTDDTSKKIVCMIDLILLLF